MGILVKDLDQDGISFEAYLDYLNSVKGKLADSAYEYGVAAWHYDISDPRCLHDAWLQSLTISEILDAQPAPERFAIRIEFLGAFHDRVLRYDYSDVVSYELVAQEPAHGDVYFDEVRLSDRGNVVHEILFASNARWVIEAKTFRFSWDKLK